MVERAIRLEGTCTGEHGVGLGKVEYLESELGEGTVGLMETIKRMSESSATFCRLLSKSLFLLCFISPAPPILPWRRCHYGVTGNKAYSSQWIL